MPNFRRINLENYFYFVTTKTINNAPIFRNEKHCDLFIENIKFYRTRMGFLLLSYVIVPDHFHGVIVPDVKGGDISTIMRNIKYRTARDIHKYCQHIRRSGPGPDLRCGQIWQPRFYDEIIRNEKHLSRSTEYIHTNPEKHGFTDNYTKWKYSSYKNYFLNDNSIIKIDSI